jgi:hypothetical protein
MSNWLSAGFPCALAPMFQQGTQWRYELYQRGRLQ